MEFSKHKILNLIKELVDWETCVLVWMQESTLTTSCNSQNPLEPNFTIKTRAAAHQPDMFYVSKHIGAVAENLL